MADSGKAGPSSGSASQVPKVIPSLAKKQSDVTRLGTQKLKFVPTLPARRKKEDVKAEEPSAASTSTPISTRGRGRGADRGGRGRGRGGEGRGAAPRTPIEMTASGPFAMGPTLAGQTPSRRAAPRSNFTPMIPQALGGMAKLGAGLTATTAPSLAGGVKREQEEGGFGKGKAREEEEGEEEVYSDADEGVEIVDIEKVRIMDWMAPESLKREREIGKKKRKKVKTEEKEVKGKGVARPDVMDVDQPREEVNLANAIDLSESEEEEELEDIVEDFAQPATMQEDLGIRQERLYFFQFPEPFPTFLPSKSASTSVSMSEEKGKNVEGARPTEGTKKVSFAEDTKPPAAAGSARATPTVPTGTAGGDQVKKEEQEEQKVDGMIGQLEVYQSGAVKMRMGNGIVLDVTGATQPSFLQHAVYLDTDNKRLCVLGEVNRRFVVSPDLEALLAGLELAEHTPPPGFDDAGLITMDTS